MSWVLIIHESKPMLDLVAGALRTMLPSGTRQVPAINLDDAKKALGEWGTKTCYAIVCSLTAPVDADHAPSIERRDLTSLQFVRDLRAQDATMPCIFLAAFSDSERTAEVAQVSGTSLIGMNDMWTHLPREVKAALRGKTEPSLHQVDLDIVLRKGEQGTWRLKGVEGNPLEDSGVMDIESSDIDGLLAMSKPAHAGDDEFLRGLGLSVYKLLMSDSLKSDHLETKLRLSLVPYGGGLECARIRFNVDHQTHRILLETLAAPPGRNRDPEFWMLKTPMFRKLGTRGARYPLFQNPATKSEPVDCLIIQGNVSSFAVGAPFNREFVALEHAKEEVDWLQELLETRRKELGIGTVKVLRYNKASKAAFSQSIKHSLQDERTKFELVHYAGHSGLDAAGEPYLLLGNKSGDVLDLTEFSVWARNVQFVYLSSCESASSQFVMKGVEREVPAVIGYGWSVEDSVATDFAQAFYERLLGGDRDRRQIEYSFMAAKQRLHKKYPTKAHWAAPLLFMQVFDKQSTPSTN